MTPPPDAPDKFADFLMAEYQHVTESLLKSEEEGETRVSMFITTASAVGGALGFLLGKGGGAEVLAGGSEGPLIGPRSLAAVTLIALLSLGYLTMLRVIARNKASDGYKEGLRRIRLWFVMSDPQGLGAYLPFDVSRPASRHPLPAFRFGSGGWLDFVILVNALIAGALAADIGTLWSDQFIDWHLKPSVVDGLIGAAVTVAARMALIRKANRLYPAQDASARAVTR